MRRAGLGAGLEPSRLPRALTIDVVATHAFRSYRADGAIATGLRQVRPRR